MRFLSLALVLLAAGCAGNQPVRETTYSGGLPTGTATVAPTKKGGWQTQSGDAAVDAPGTGLEPESQMPYGGGASGIRAMEDEEF